MHKKSEKLSVKTVRFLKEQDGIPERELKSRLCDFFLECGCQCRAYLVSVDYGCPDEFNVALCVRMESDETKNFHTAVQQIFADMFRTEEHLDVIIVSDYQEQLLLYVAKPFFSG